MSSGDHGCLHQMSWLSIHYLSEQVSLDQSGGWDDSDKYRHMIFFTILTSVLRFSGNLTWVSAGVSGMWITQASKKRISITPNFSRRSRDQRHPDLLKLGDSKKTKQKKNSRLKEECVVVAPPHPFALVTNTKCSFSSSFYVRLLTVTQAVTTHVSWHLFSCHFFSPHKSLIGFCFYPPLMWSLYTRLKWMDAQAGFEGKKKKKLDSGKFFGGGSVNVVGHRNYYV